MCGAGGQEQPRPGQAGASVSNQRGPAPTPCPRTEAHSDRRLTLPALSSILAVASASVPPTYGRPSCF
jgi:hypothetical protein